MVQPTEYHFASLKSVLLTIAAVTRIYIYVYRPDIHRYMYLYDDKELRYVIYFKFMHYLYIFITNILQCNSQIKSY